MASTECVTVRGYYLLENELKVLKRRREEIIASIDEARKHGDLSENAEYHIAKSDQQANDSRISDLEPRLMGAQIIDYEKWPKSDRAQFGVGVTLRSLTSDKTVTVRLVGSKEADYDRIHKIEKGRISYTSPVGRALILKRINDVVELDLLNDGNTQRYRIEDIEFNNEPVEEYKE